METSDPKADRRDGRTGSRVSLQTLIIASVASAVASFAASRIWGAGTLISAAATPVIVALVAEFLRRPVQTVAATAKKVPTAQTFPAFRERTVAAPEDPTGVGSGPARVTTESATRDEAQSDPGLPEPRRPVESPASIAPEADPGTINPNDASWHPRWRLAVVTGVVAFAVVVALYTLPDLLAGRSITGNGQPTTFFGGSASVKTKASPTRTVTRSTPTTTVTTTAPTTTTATTKTAPTTTTAKTTTTNTAATTTPTTSSTLSSSTTTTPTTPVP